MDADQGIAHELHKPEALPDESEQTTLQRHVAFWDREGTGIISPISTYIGFYEIGCECGPSFVSVAEGVLILAEQSE